MSMSTRVPIGFLVKDSYVELRGYIGDRGGIESKPDVNKERRDSKMFVFAPIFYVHIDKLTNVGGFNPSRDGKQCGKTHLSSIPESNSVILFRVKRIVYFLFSTNRLLAHPSILIRREK
jgi:hypothetical protein